MSRRFFGVVFVMVACLVFVSESVSGSLEASRFTALAAAVATGSEGDVRRLLLEGADVNEVGYGERTALMYSAGRPDSTITQLLIDVGANVDVKDRDGYSPLHLAVFAASLPNVDLLSKSQINISSQGGLFKRTPLHLAVKTSCWGCVESLLHAKPNLLVEDSFGMTPFDVCQEMGSNVFDCSRLQGKCILPLNQ